MVGGRVIFYNAVRITVGQGHICGRIRETPSQKKCNLEGLKSGRKVRLIMREIGCRRYPRPHAGEAGGRRPLA
jgi:hypothetical protein